MNKIIALSVGSLMVLSLAACAAPASGSATLPDSGVEQRVLSASESLSSPVSAAENSTLPANLTAEDEIRAKTAAFSHANVTEADAQNLVVKVDREDGRIVYEVHFDAGDLEYDYEIDAETFEIVSYDRDTKKSVASGSDAGNDASSAALKKSEAIEIALKTVSGAKEADVFKAKQDQEHGKTVYEVELIVNGVEYELEIDAATGEILSRSEEKADSSDLKQKSSGNDVDDDIDDDHDDHDDDDDDHDDDDHDDDDDGDATSSATRHDD